MRGAGGSLSLLKARLGAAAPQAEAGAGAGAGAGAAQQRQPADEPADERGAVLLLPRGEVGGAVVDAARGRLTLQRPRSAVQRVHAFFRAAAEPCSAGAAALLAERLVGPLVHGALAEGESVLVTALGAKGSGKSSALRGPGCVLDRLAAQAWAGAQEAREAGGYAEARLAVACVVDAITAPVESHVTGKKYAHEVLMDGLARRAAREQGAQHVGHLTQRLREHPRFGFFLEGLSWAEARSQQELAQLLAQAARACDEEEQEAAAQREEERAAGAASSSSGKKSKRGAAPQALHHLVLVRVQLEHADGTFVQMEAGVLDLQGVARPAPPPKGATPAQRKAAIAARPAEDPVQAALSRCLDAAADKRSHMPVRDSKLTRLVSPMLYGSARAVAVLAVDLADDAFEETDAACIGASRFAKLLARDEKRACLAAAWNFGAERARAAAQARELATALGLPNGTVDTQTATDVQLDMSSSDELLAYRDALAARDAAEADAAFWGAACDEGAELRDELLLAAKAHA